MGLNQRYHLPRLRSSLEHPDPHGVQLKALQTLPFGRSIGRGDRASKKVSPVSRFNDHNFVHASCWWFLFDGPRYRTFAQPTSTG